MKDLLKRMIPNPLRLAFKMFGLVWFVLILQVILKLTFNYWQPYILPNERLVVVSEFIDTHNWIKITIDLIYYYISAIFVILSSIQCWKFKNKKITIIMNILIVICYFINVFTNLDTITSILLTIIMPIILNRKKWLYTIITFILSNVFLFVSLWINNFTRTDNNSTFINILFMNDYYIMLILNYILFNIIRIKKEGNQMGLNVVFAWFGGKTIEELKAIKETQWETLTEKQREELDYAIALQEGK